MSRELVGQTLRFCFRRKAAPQGGHSRNIYVLTCACPVF